MTAPTDHKQRIAALDPTRSFIVQAPAGSGKTGLLVRRYLTLLARVAEPEEILAITFTRKATTEMRTRILNALAGKDADIKKLATNALAHDQRMGWNILDNPGRLKIQTIDAFCYELVKRMPWSARFGAAPEVLEEQHAELIYRQAAKRTLGHIDGRDPLSGHCANLLKLLDTNFGKAQSLLAGMLRKRDRWMRGLEVNTRAEYEMMWREVVEQQLETAAHCIADEIKPRIASLASFAADNPYPRKPNVALMGCLQMTEFPPPLIENLPHWRGIAALLLTNQLQVRKSVDVRLGFPANFKQEKGHMKALLEDLSDDAVAAHELSKIPPLPDDTFTDKQWQVLQSLLALLPIVAAELRLLFKENNCADYVEVAQRAEMSFGEDGSPSDITLFFDYQLKHLLMDEVQDTSRSQFDLLIKLTSGWQRGDGRTLFFVGDPMQSIYRFREAEVAHFLAMQEHGIGEVKPQPLTLETNFRSTSSLVTWYNDAFTKIFPPQNDIINGAISYSPSIALRSEDDLNKNHNHRSSAVQIHPEAAGNRESEAMNIGRQIQAELAQNPTAQIGVLGRTRGHLVTITQALRKQHILFQAIELESLIKRPPIQDLMALTRALLHLSDRIAWLSILRAPWCGLTLADMSILAMGDHRRPIVALCKDNKITAHLSADGWQRITRLLAKLEIPLAQRGRVSLRKNVEAAWLSLSAPACIDYSDIVDCESYFDRLSKLEKDDAHITASLLSETVAQLWSKADAKAQVQVLTIHKSKGLEFDVVFLPQLHRSIRASEAELIRWTRLPDQLLIAVLPHSHAQDDKHYKYLGELEQFRQYNELCRLLYVAVTRARSKLHLYMDVSMDNEGHPKPPRPDSLLHLLWPVLATEITQHLSQPVRQAPATAQTPTLPLNAPPAEPLTEFKRLPLQWDTAIPHGIAALPHQQTEAKPAALNLIEFSWAGETARIVGTAIHQMLQQIDHQNWQQWKAEDTETALSRNRNVLMDNGLYGQQLEVGLENMRIAIENIRSDVKADWIFSSSHQQVKREWSLTAVVNKTISSIIIDRSFIDQYGIRWIVDFKSSHHKGNIDNFIAQEKIRYQQQLEHYASVVGMLESRTTKDRIIKLGIYFPLLKGWCEWSPPSSGTSTNGTV